jgi:hypothetical protein
MHQFVAINLYCKQGQTGDAFQYKWSIKGVLLTVLIIRASSSEPLTLIANAISGDLQEATLTYTMLTILAVYIYKC